MFGFLKRKGRAEIQPDFDYDETSETITTDSREYAPMNDIPTEDQKSGSGKRSFFKSKSAKKRKNKKTSKGSKGDVAVSSTIPWANMVPFAWCKKFIIDQCISHIRSKTAFFKLLSVILVVAFAVGVFGGMWFEKNSFSKVEFRLNTLNLSLNKYESLADRLSSYQLYNEYNNPLSVLDQFDVLSDFLTTNNVGVSKVEFSSRPSTMNLSKEMTDLFLSESGDIGLENIVYGGAWIVDCLSFDGISFDHTWIMSVKEVLAPIAAKAGFDLFVYAEKTSSEKSMSRIHFILWTKPYSLSYAIGAKGGKLYA